MVIIWGQRMYGRVDRFAGSHVVTRFFHLYYVPLIPLSSWLVLEEQADGAFLGVRLPFQWRSILLAWLRLGAVLATVGAVCGLVEQTSRTSYGAHGPDLLIRHAVSLVLAVALAGFAYLRVGKLSREEKAARVVYWDFAGRFVDVGLLAEERGALKQRATAELERHLARHATATYREAPQASWRELVTRPGLRDVPLLKAALTRSRIEWAEARGLERRAFAREHARILESLLAASPELLDTERFELKA